MLRLLVITALATTVVAMLLAAAAAPDGPRTDGASVDGGASPVGPR